jgi:hypothetical protein
MLNEKVSAFACLTLIFLLHSRVFAQTSEPSDALQPQTSWKGSEQGGPRIATRRGNIVRSTTVNILTRDGERFTFEYWITAGTAKHGLAMEGQIQNGQIIARATKIIQGGVWETNILKEPWTGGLKDDTLILQRTNTTNDAVLTATLTLDPSGARAGRRGGRRGRSAGSS